MTNIIIMKNIWNIVRTTKMWQKHRSKEMPVRKLVPIVFLNRRLPQSSNCKKCNICKVQESKVFLYIDIEKDNHPDQRKRQSSRPTASACEMFFFTTFLVIVKTLSFILQIWVTLLSLWLTPLSKTLLRKPVPFKTKEYQRKEDWNCIQASVGSWSKKLLL